MPRSEPRQKRSRLRAVAAMLGVVLLLYLLRRAGLSAVLVNIRMLGAGLVVIIALGGVSHLLKAWAWRLTLGEAGREVAVPRMVALRLVSEAAAQLGLAGRVAGETMRVALLGPSVPVSSGISSAALDQGLYMVTGAIVSVVGLVIALARIALPHVLEVYLLLFCLALLGFVGAIGFAVQQRRLGLSQAFRLAGRIPRCQSFFEEKYSLIQSTESKMLDFCHQSPGRFWGSAGLNVAAHVLAILEVYLILVFLGAKLSFVSALVVEALTKLVNVIGAVNPGNIGTYEGGNVFILKMFGLGSAVGLTLGIARRVRALFWTGAGVICLVTLSNARTWRQPA